MRKDVQIGLAIGGVFLAVVIVWGVVISGSHKKTKNPVSLDTNGRTQGTGSSAARGGSDIPPPIDHPAATDDHGTDVVNPSRPGTDSPAPAGTDTPGTGTGTGATPAPAPGTGDAEASAPDRKDINWHQLLLADRPEDLPGALHTATPPTGAGSATPGGDSTQIADARAARATGGAAGSPAPAGPTLPPAPTDTTTPPTTGPADLTTGGHTNTGGTPAAPTGGRKHTVQRGETFSTISKLVYGDSRHFTQILKANPTINPNRLKPGTVIDVPDLAAASDASSHAGTGAAAAPRSPEARATAAAPAVDGRSEYRVASGDSLYKISTHLYGSAEEVDHLYELNKAAIGPDKGRLKLGMVLKLPAPPTATASR